MSQQTKRAPGRPKKAPAVDTPTAPMPTKKVPILQKKTEARHCVFEIPTGGGVAFLIQQRGITVYDESTDTVRQSDTAPMKILFGLTSKAPTQKKKP